MANYRCSAARCTLFAIVVCLAFVTLGSGAAAANARRPKKPDTQAPTAPSLLLKSGASTSSESLAWQPSLDNVGVAGYTVYVSSVKVGTTALTSYTAGNLACGQ